MKTHMLLLAAIALGSLSSTPSLSQAPVKLVICGGVPIVEGVFLNGSGPYRFLLDTGSQTNQVDPALAFRLGLKPTEKISLNTPAGSSDAVAGFVDTLTLGSMQATHQEFLLMKLYAVRQHCPGVRGILGQEFLANFDYLLDVRHHRMIQMEPPEGRHVPVRFIYGRMAIPTSFGDMVLDSGAQTLLLFRTSFVQPNAGITTAEGSELAVSTELVGGMQIDNRSYLVAKADFVSVPQTEEAGLLPTNMFQALYVCNSKGYVILDPKIPG